MQCGNSKPHVVSDGFAEMDWYVFFLCLNEVCECVLYRYRVTSTLYLCVCVCMSACTNFAPKIRRASELKMIVDFAWVDLSNVISVNSSTI